MSNTREFTFKDPQFAKVENDKEARDAIRKVVSRNALALQHTSVSSTSDLDPRYSVVFISNSAALTLPEINYYGDDRTPMIEVISTDTSTCSVDTPSAAQTINGSTSAYNIYKGGNVTFYADVRNSNWIVQDNTYFNGTWTPTLTFATPGDVSVTYATRLGTYTLIGKRMFLEWVIITSAFTHTTAAGDMKITGVPIDATADNHWLGDLYWAGITKAGYTDISARVITNEIFGIAFGSGVAASAVAAADMPTGGSVTLRGQVSYRI